MKDTEKTIIATTARGLYQTRLADARDAYAQACDVVAVLREANASIEAISFATGVREEKRLALEELERSRDDRARAEVESLFESGLGGDDIEDELDEIAEHYGYGDGYEAFELVGLEAML